MENISETLINKKLDSYGTELNDFKSEKELTVEITLNEYRKLISSKATKDADIEKANTSKWKIEEENRNLKADNERLEKKLFEYRKRFGDLDTKVEKSENEED